MVADSDITHRRGTSALTKNERLLVCIAPGAHAMRLVEHARKTAQSMDAELIVLHVENNGQQKNSEADVTRFNQAMEMADAFHIETITLSGQNIAHEIITFARTRGVTMVIAGNSRKPRTRFQNSTSEQLLKQAGDIPVLFIHGGSTKQKRLYFTTNSESFTVRSVFEAVGVIIACTAINDLFFRGFDHSNIIMIYLAGVAIIASRYGYRESALASILSVSAFDFFFVPPFLTFAVGDSQYFIVFLVMLGIALLISRLTLRLRAQIQYSSERERRTAALYKMTKELSISESLDEVLVAGVHQIATVYSASISLFLEDSSGDLLLKIHSDTQFEAKTHELAVAQWVCQHGERAGKGTMTLPGSESLYLPLTASRGIIGVLGIQFANGQLPVFHRLSHLETFANALSLAVERAQLAEETVSVRLENETEKIRNALLSSVSHDLRTPLTVISGTAEDIIGTSGDNAGLRDRASIIMDEADRLNRHLTNLLDMTRLESGIHIKREWNSLEELLGTALSRTKTMLAPREIKMEIDPDLALVEVDAVLTEKVFRNLLDNIVKHTPATGSITIKGSNGSESVNIEICDSGPGLKSGKEQEVFQKFYQEGFTSGENGGFGLGLSICKTIMDLHHGSITAYNHPIGGACFRMEFPRGRSP